MDGIGNEEDQAPQPSKRNWWEGASFNLPDSSKDVTKVVLSWKDLRSPEYCRAARQARESSETTAAALCDADYDSSGKHKRSSSGPSKEEFEELRSAFIHLREETNSMKVEFEEKIRRIRRIKTESDEMAAGFTAKINEMATTALESASKIRNLEGLLAQAGRGGEKRSNQSSGTRVADQQQGPPMKQHPGPQLRPAAAVSHLSSTSTNTASGVPLDAQPKLGLVADIPTSPKNKSSTRSSVPSIPARQSPPGTVGYKHMSRNGIPVWSTNLRREKTVTFFSPAAPT